MKNIHVLPTSQPSRLAYFGTSRSLSLYEGTVTFRAFERSTQNIYITNDESRQRTDWVVYKDAITKLEVGDNELFHLGKKIILTTDQDLIKDGVQSIDDEFLEWFVKNPTCEEIVVIYEPKNFFDVKKGWEYKIIFPKEEQKQHIIDIMKSDEELGLYEQTKCYCGHTTTCDCEPEQHVDFINSNIDEFDKALKLPKQEDMITKIMQMDAKMAYDSLPKQETLEEAAIYNYKELYEGEPLTQDGPIDAFKQGAKWQQEQDNKELAMWKLAVEKQEARCTSLRGVISDLQDKNKYSEEDLKEAFKSGGKMSWTDINQETQEPYYYDFKELFEQFKKK